ncbi:MAG: hypothetical protein WDZ79_02185 [Candidatus Paceibacterota bacterium]
MPRKRPVTKRRPITLDLKHIEKLCMQMQDQELRELWDELLQRGSRFYFLGIERFTPKRVAEDDMDVVERDEYLRLQNSFYAVCNQLETRLTALVRLHKDDVRKVCDIPDDRNPIRIRPFSAVGLFCGGYLKQEGAS